MMRSLSLREDGPKRNDGRPHPGRKLLTASSQVNNAEIHAVDGFEERIGAQSVRHVARHLMAAYHAPKMLRRIKKQVLVFNISGKLLLAENGGGHVQAKSRLRGP